MKFRNIDIQDEFSQCSCLHSLFRPALRLLTSIQSSLVLYNLEFRQCQCLLILMIKKFIYLPFFELLSLRIYFCFLHRHNVTLVGYHIIHYPLSLSTTTISQVGVTSQFQKCFKFITPTKFTITNKIICHNVSIIHLLIVTRVTYKI